MAGGEGLGTRIYVATTNAGKLRDFRFAAEGMQADGRWGIDPLPGLAELPAPVEDADSFEGNARLKAVFYSQEAPGEWVLADDSGLEVDALGGRPGVRSARFAQDLEEERRGADANRGAEIAGSPEAQHADARNMDARNNAELLQLMAGADHRRARYRCALALARDGQVRQVSFGTMEGEILEIPRGNAGFGYDPLFFVPEAGCTMAEISAEERIARSHRGQALRRLLSAMADAE